jgi:hypothetical protein
VMAALPTEVSSAIVNAVKANPSAEVFVIVREVIESLGGAYPDKFIAWLKAAGGASEFVQAIQAEVRRVKSSGRKP